MFMTQHAQARLQQRGIPMEALEVLDYFGVEFRQKGGNVLMQLSKKDLSCLKKKVKALDRAINKIDICYAVTTDEGICITTSHKNKRLRHIGKRCGATKGT